MPVRYSSARALETGKEAEETFEKEVWEFFFPLFHLIKGQGEAKAGFLIQASWHCCGAEEEAEEELPASLAGLGSRLGSLAGNLSG